MKILRLSLFNLKKNKKEAMAIAFLTLVTTLMLCIFIANNSKSSNVFDESYAASGSVSDLIIFEEAGYRDTYSKILENEYNPQNLREIKTLFVPSADVIEYDGNAISYNMLFVTEKTERKLENFTKRDCLNEEEISNIAHPIWLPQCFEINNGYKLKDKFSVLKAGKEYPFEVVGFYETGLAANDGYGYKAIISDEDYELFVQIFNSMMASEYRGLAFDYENDFPYNEYLEKCEEKSGENVKNNSYLFSKSREKNSETQFVDIFLLLIVFISIVTMIAAMFMIRHKISNDLEDQMQQIGVLEALGYKSGEISLSYLFEYIISGGIGAVLGVLTAIILTPAQNGVIRSMMGRDIEGRPEILKLIIVAIVVVIIVTLFALIKARSVKKYPPVIAFRKGIKTHNFKKNVLPLEKAKGNINFRLAMKGLMQEMKGSIGIAICIITTGTALLFGLMTFGFFKNGTEGLMSMMGIDVEPVVVVLANGVDPYETAAKMQEDPEVEKAIVSYDFKKLTVSGSDDAGSLVIYDNFKDAKQFSPFEGRFPEHDNEVAIAVKRADYEQRAIGDSLILEHNGIKRSYIITGTVSSLYNGGSAIYMTSEAFRRIDINARPNVVNVYLKDGTDPEKYEKQLLETYGGSAKDKANTGVAEGSSEENISATTVNGTLEEKRSAKAEEKIATLLSQYGVTSVDYAVRIGDKLITGNSRNFIIKEVRSWRGMIKSQMEPIADATRAGTLGAAVLVIFIVFMILIIISASNVKRQRKNLGIMKSLGYSSKDLRRQMALKVMPVMIVSMVIASIVAIYVNKVFWSVMFATIATTDIILIICVDIAMIVLAYIMTYIGAGKIKKISVTELMTE